MKFALTLILLSELLLGQGGKKGPAKKKQESTYNPDTLPANEKACGRSHAKNNHPCECMRHRVRLADEARKKCDLILDDKERLECGLKASPCHVDVVDWDTRWNGSDGQSPMPLQCSRSCRLARCECCKS